MTRQIIDPLLESFTLKNLQLRNRVVSTSHEPSYTEDGMPKDRYRLYHVEKDKGGIGLTMMGGSAVVAPESPAAFGNLHVYKDEVVPWLRELAYDVHEHGAGVMCQITHLGRRTSNYDGDWLPVVFPSPLREPAHRAFPKVAEEWDMDRIVRAYADATARCREAGLDGIELEAYTHLLDAFWSPLTNHREDEYGGSLEDRLRFPLRVIRAVREAAGPDFIVGIRMSFDEQTPGGLGREEALEIARQVVAEGVDFISIIRDHPETKFCVFVPPYSILQFVTIRDVSPEALQTIYDFSAYAFPRLLSLPNVTLFDFRVAQDITHDLDNYMDLLHYRPMVDQRVLSLLAGGKYRVTRAAPSDSIERLARQVATFDTATMRPHAVQPTSDAGGPGCR